MTSRYSQSPYMRVQQPTLPNRQYILFTWSKCKQCQDLKRNLSGYLQSGRIKEYDLDSLSNNPNLMRLFLQVSPGRNVPAMAILNNGMLESALVGVGKIMNTRFL